VTARYAGYVAWRGLVDEADVPEKAAVILCERFTFYESPNTGVPRAWRARGDRGREVALQLGLVS
jgi:hypothetical protein